MTASELSDVAALLRVCAQEELLPRFRQVEREYKADGSIVTEADHAVQTRLQRELRERWPQIGFLAEEMSEAERQAAFAQEGPLWVLDPLDGTSNFAAGIPYFGISLALLAEGERRLALVYDPCRDECYSADERGAYLNGENLCAGSHAPDELARAIAVVDFKRLPQALAEQLAVRPPYASQRSFGSVALDLCWLAAGRGHVYLHGRANLWDYIAGSLILERSGGVTMGLDGEPLFQSQLQARSIIAATTASLFERWRQALGISHFTARQGESSV